MYDSMINHLKYLDDSTNFLLLGHPYTPMDAFTLVPNQGAFAPNFLSPFASSIISKSQFLDMPWLAVPYR